MRFKQQLQEQHDVANEPILSFANRTSIFSFAKTYK